MPGTNLASDNREKFIQMSGRCFYYLLTVKYDRRRSNFRVGQADLGSNPGSARSLLDNLG